MASPHHHIARAASLGLVLLALAACGGGGQMPPPTYSIGGTVSGIAAGQSLILENNGGDALTVSANGAFTFATKVASGGSYAVTATAPTGSNCAVSGASGTVSANVTTVIVACLPASAEAFTVGGTVSGLVGQGLTLEIINPPNTAHHGVVLSTLDVSQDGTYRAGRAPDGYQVVVEQQPHSPMQQCVVRNDLGSNLIAPMPADVTGVDVVCGEFAYLTNVAGNSISTFSVDAATGALRSAGTSAATGRSPKAIASTPDKKFLYVSNGGSDDISVYTVDPAAGTLKSLLPSTVAAGSHPQALGLHTAVSIGYGPDLVSFYLFVANAGSNTLSGYWIDRASGLPHSLSSAAANTGSGPTVMAIAPTNPVLPTALLYTANTGGSGDISAFAFDTQTKQLNPLAGSPYASGSSVSSLAFGTSDFESTSIPGGGYLYAASATGTTATIDGYKIADDGELATLSGFPVSLPSCRYIATDRSGSFLYALVGPDILGYSIDRVTGALSPLAGPAVTVGGSPRSLSIDPTSQFLYATDEGTGTVTGFELNAATGALTAMPGSPFAVGSSVDFIATF